MNKLLLFLLFVFLLHKGYSQSTSVPFTLEDRDRIMRTEQEIKSLRNEINIRFENQQQQINDLKESIKDIKVMLLWGFGILFSLFLFMLGFIIWDRRTALNPVRVKTETLSNVLRDFAKENTRLAEILRTYGLM
jgi:hypothetical protein